MRPVAEQTGRADRWDELIAAEGVVAQALAKTFGSLPAEKRAELILDAELELIEKWQAGEITWPANPAAWLVSAAGSDARDLIKTTRGHATDAAGLAGTDYEAGVALAAEAEHERALSLENAQGLYALLSPTQRHIAVLRFSAGLEPRAIAKQLKLPRRTVYKHLDAISNRLRAPAGELAAGNFPRAWDELIRGHVAGTLLPHDRAKAAALLQTNTDAQLFALQLHRAGDQLAALITPAALLEAPDVHGPLGRIPDRASDLAGAAREAIENAAATIKHQAANLSGRVAETVPAIASSPRSGAGAILASCVLAAGGGTVCVITGTTPNDLAEIFGQENKPKLAREPPPRKPAAAVPVAATARPTPLPRRRPKRPAPEPPPAAPRAPAPTTAPAPSPGQEFDPLAGSAQAAPQVAAPAPAPPPELSGGGEFGGP